MQENSGALFIGAAPLKPLIPFLKSMKERYPRFVEPAAGFFQMCRYARQAGYPAARLEASDVMLSSAVFGYYLAGRDLEELAIRIPSMPDIDVTDPAQVLYADRLLQLKASKPNPKQDAEIEHFERTRANQIDAVRTRLAQNRFVMGGMKYEPRDMMDHLQEAAADPKALIMLNPPYIKGGYEKLNDTDEAISWRSPNYALFDPKTGKGEIEDIAEKAAAMVVCYLDNDHGYEPRLGKLLMRANVRKGSGKSFGPIPTNAIHYYAVCNRPDEFRSRSMLVKRKTMQFRPLEGCHPHLLGNPLKAKHLRMQRVKGENAGWYRHLWTHQFPPNQSGSIDYLVMLDNQPVAAVGWTGSVTGTLMTPANSNDHPDTFLCHYTVGRGSKTRIPRLMVMLSYSRVMLREMLSDMDFELVRRVQTTQITKYPESKPHRGLSDLVLREDQKDGYRLVYQSKRLDDRPVQEIFEVWRDAEKKRFGKEWENVT